MDIDALSLCAQAPKVAAIARIISAFTNFILFHILSALVAVICLGQTMERAQLFSRAAFLRAYSFIVTGVSSSMRSNSSMTSVFRILIHPWLAGWPILSSCCVPWM